MSEWKWAYEDEDGCLAPVFEMELRNGRWRRILTVKRRVIRGPKRKPAG